MRKSELGTANLSHVERTVNTRAAWGPTCDSSNARDAEEGSGTQKVRLKRALVTSPGCPVLPASQEVSRLIFAVGGVGGVGRRGPPRPPPSRVPRRLVCGGRPRLAPLPSKMAQGRAEGQGVGPQYPGRACG